MNKFNISKKIIILSLTGAVIISMVGFTNTSAAANSTDSAQVTAVSQSEKDERDSKPGFKNELQKFVDEKVITKDQAKKIEAFLEKRRSERKAEHEKLKSMTQAERDKYIQNNMNDRHDLFSELVSQGIINKDQAAKMKAELPKMKEARLQEILKGEVAKGTIKQEQLNKINEFMTKKKEERLNEHEKFRNMTEEEKKLYLYQHSKQKTDLLSELVASGIITKDQSDALSRVLPQLHKDHPRKGAPGNNPSNIS